MRAWTDLFSKSWFTFAQLLTVPANFVLTRLLKLQVIRPPGLTIEHGTLIIANHQSKIDPFLISYHVGLKNLIKVVPIRYPVTPDFMNRKVLGFFIALLGGYSIGETPLERLQKLTLTRELLKKRYSVVLFPEGKISYNNEGMAEFQRGAEMLLSHNYPVLFVRLTGLNETHKFHFWKNTRARFVYSECMGPAVSREAKVAAMMHFFNVTHK